MDFHLWYTYKAEKGLMVLFFGLVFFVDPLPWKFFSRRPFIWHLFHTIYYRAASYLLFLYINTVPDLATPSL